MGEWRFDGAAGRPSIWAVAGLLGSLAFLTAGVTSTVIQRREAGTAEEERGQRERDLQTIVDALAQTRQAIERLDDRLADIESRLGS